MQTPIIEYDIQMNKGDYAGQIVKVHYFLEEIEKDGLNRRLIEDEFLTEYTNSGEYEVLSRKLKL